MVRGVGRAGTGGRFDSGCRTSSESTPCSEPPCSTLPPPARAVNLPSRLLPNVPVMTSTAAVSLAGCSSSLASTGDGGTAATAGGTATAAAAARRRPLGVAPSSADSVALRHPRAAASVRQTRSNPQRHRARHARPPLSRSARGVTVSRSAVNGGGNGGRLWRQRGGQHRRPQERGGGTPTWTVGGGATGATVAAAAAVGIVAGRGRALGSAGRRSQSRMGGQRGEGAPGKTRLPVCFSMQGAWEAHRRPSARECRCSAAPLETAGPPAVRQVSRQCLPRQRRRAARAYSAASNSVGRNRAMYGAEHARVCLITIRERAGCVVSTDAKTMPVTRRASQHGARGRGGRTAA